MVNLVEELRVARLLPKGDEVEDCKSICPQEAPHAASTWLRGPARAIPGTVHFIHDL